MIGIEPSIEPPTLCCWCGWRAGEPVECCDDAFICHDCGLEHEFLCPDCYERWRNDEEDNGGDD